MTDRNTSVPSDPVIAPAHQSITESMVVQALDAATIRQLAVALDPGAFKADHGSDGFRCPDCGTWSAVIIDAWRWTCRWCVQTRESTTGGQRTRLALRARVGESYEACVRLVQEASGPSLRPVPSTSHATTGGRVLG